MKAIVNKADNNPAVGKKGRETKDSKNARMFAANEVCIRQTSKRVAATAVGELKALVAADLEEQEKERRLNELARLEEADVVNRWRR